MAKSKTTAPTAKRRYAQRLTLTDRREQLLDTALRIIGTAGFGAVNIAAVAEQSGVTRPVVYDSFSSRDELLEALIERETSRMSDTVERAVSAALDSSPDVPPKVALRDGLRQLFEGVRATPDSWRLVYSPINSVPGALRSRLESAHEELRVPLRQVVGNMLADEPEDTAAVDPDVLVGFLQAVIQTSARLTLDEPDRFDTERLLAFFDFVLDWRN